MSDLSYGGRHRSTRRKSRRGGAKRDEKAHRKMEDATRHTMSRFVRGAPVHHRPAAALLSARRPENERRLSAYQLSRGPIGMPKIMIVPRDPNLPVRQVESAPGSPNLPIQNPPRGPGGPAIMPFHRNNPSPVRSAPPSPRNGGRSRKTRRRHK